MQARPVAVALAGAMFLSTFVAAAQEAPPPIAPLRAAAPSPRYRSPGKRIAGIVLTAVGAAMAVPGIALIAYGSVQKTCETCDFPAGLTEIMIGSILLGSGGVMGPWARGSGSGDPRRRRCRR